MKTSNPELLAEIDLLGDATRKKNEHLEVVKLIDKQANDIALLRQALKECIECIRGEWGKNACTADEELLEATKDN